MNRDSFRYKLKNKPLLSLIGGFAIAAAAFGILIVIILVFVEPMSAPERAGTVHFHADHFNLWYRKKAAGISGHAALAIELNRELDELVNLLDVDQKLIPDPIDVFVHDDINEMQASIAKRKAPESRGGYMAPLDLLVGESPRRRLAELVLAFGWGQCGSRFLEQGVALYASAPQRNFHGVIAALPNRLYYTLPELIAIEGRGGFEESIYEQYDSPYSRVLIGFGNYKDLLELSAKDAGDPANITGLEAASFVQYVIEHLGGMKEVKRIWGKGKTERLLARIGPSITDLSREWHDAAIVAGEAAGDYPYLKVYYSLANGDPDAAWGLAQELVSDNPSQDDLLLAGRCAVSVGAFGRAREIAERITDGKKKEELQGYLDLYEGWRVTEAEGLRFLVSPGIATGRMEDMISRARTGYGRIVDELGLGVGERPQPMTIFVYEDDVARIRGKKLVPLLPIQNGTLHVVSADDTTYAMAQMLPAYAWGKDTYSRLLRTGLAVALSRSKDELVQQGCALRSSDSWVPLARADFGAAGEETIRVEAGLMLRYLLDEGVQNVRKVWIATSPADLYLSVDDALVRVFGKTREQIENVLLSSVLICK